MLLNFVTAKRKGNGLPRGHGGTRLRVTAPCDQRSITAPGNLNTVERIGRFNYGAGGPPPGDFEWLSLFHHDRSRAAGALALRLSGSLGRAAAST